MTNRLKATDGNHIHTIRQKVTPIIRESEGLGRVEDN